MENKNAVLLQSLQPILLDFLPSITSIRSTFACDFILVTQTQLLHQAPSAQHNSHSSRFDLGPVLQRSFSGSFQSAA